MFVRFVACLPVLLLAAGAVYQEEPLPTPPAVSLLGPTAELETIKVPVLQDVTASWYGPGFDGRKTANGETYNMERLTAAHRNLPFGTRIVVYNPKNGNCIEIRINDRGPYDPNQLPKLRPHPERDLDLSKASARLLGTEERGVAKLVAMVL